MLCIEKIIAEHLKVIEHLRIADINAFIDICVHALSSGHRLFFCGNGGSAADSDHLASEFVGRFQTMRCALPAMALSANQATLTALGNDYGYEQVFARQVEAWVGAGDVLVGLSTSGCSSNIIAAAAAARGKGAVTVGLTGSRPCPLDDFTDCCIKVPSLVTARIQEAHLLIGHIVCEAVDKVYSDENK